MPLIRKVDAVIGQGDVPFPCVNKAEIHLFCQGLAEPGKGAGGVDELLTGYPRSQGHRRWGDQQDLASIQGDAQKELEYIEQALTLVKESRTMRGLAELHFKKAGLLKELMQRNKDMQQKYQKQCQVELTMAYYTALVMDNVELVQKIKTTGDRV